MPRGEVHAQITLNLAWVGSLVLIGIGTPVQDVAAFGMGILSSFWLSPDLDLPQSIPSRSWVGPPGWMWSWCQRKTRHRSPASHSIVLSSIIRITCILTFFGVLSLVGSFLTFVIVGKPLGTLSTWLSDLFQWRLFYLWVEGVIIGDVAHILADIVGSRVKKK